MDNTDFITAQQIRLRQNAITRLMVKLAANEITQDTLLDIYTVMGDAGEYDDYVGSLYTSVPDVTFSGSGDTPAEGTAIIEDGIVTAVNVTDPGSGYVSTPDIIFTGGGGSGAAAHALMGGTGDTVDSVVVDNISLVSRLVNKNFDLDDEFDAL